MTSRILCVSTGICRWKLQDILEFDLWRLAMEFANQGISGLALTRMRAAAFLGLSFPVCAFMSLCFVPALAAKIASTCNSGFLLEN